MQKTNLDYCVSEKIDRKESAETFFDIMLPNTIKIEGLYYKEFNQKQIMKSIDFTPPFLKIEKMVVFGDSQTGVGSKSVSMGRISLNDTEGHYNSTIYIAMCGKFMGQAASIHVGTLHPDTAPQVVEVGRIVPPAKDIWRPSPEGNIFLVESEIVRKRLNLFVLNVRISFGAILVGYVEYLKIALTPKNSIYDVKELL